METDYSEQKLSFLQRAVASKLQMVGEIVVAGQLWIRRRATVATRGACLIDTGTRRLTRF